MPGTKIAVLGAGNIGGTLGRQWADAGNTVTFGVAHPDGEKAQALKTELAGQAGLGTIADALPGGEVVVFAIPGRAMAETIAANAAALGGKLVIDAANRMGEPVPNSLEDFRRHAPSARYVRAFNTLGYENFADPIFDGVPADLLYVGPEADQALIEQLISEIGLRPIRVGDAGQVALVDALLSLWFALAIQRGMGRHLAFKILTRDKNE
ncbi:MAG TPA: NAD(P)-binding domain-containing protein [Ktedonobacterales bacterium]|nr:NAD(P)-binding domain-containing protein [Ktedonobacterales bacterium]